MRPATWEGELLAALAEMPLLDRLELAAVTGWSRGAVYRGVGKLEDDGLTGSVPHATGVIALTRRYHLTAAGLRRLAEINGGAPDYLLRTRPVSARWLRLLLERLDSVGLIYRLAATVANAASPIRFRWYRAAPLDAGMTLPGGRTLGILRQGASADRTGFAKRVWRLAKGPLPGAALVIVPDEVRLRHARRLLARTPVNALLALERDAALAGTEHRIWRPPTGSAVLDLGYALGRLRPGGQLSEEEPLSQAAPPESTGVALPTLLKPAGKRALDLLADWPWLSRRELAAMLDVSEPRASQVTVSLESHGLVARPWGAAGRLALTDEGLALLARRDRTSVGAAKKRWSVSLLNAGAAPGWRNVSGSRSRQLLRNIDHTAAVHEFMAALAHQSPRPGLGDGATGPAAPGVALLPPPGRPALGPPRRLRPAAPRAGRLGLLPGMGAPRRPARDHVGPPGPLPALLLHPQAHRRPRLPARRPGGLRRRPGRRPLPAAGRGRDETRRGAGPPVDLPPGRPGNPGTAGTGLADTRGLGTRTSAPGTLK